MTLHLENLMIKSAIRYLWKLRAMNCRVRGGQEQTISLDKERFKDRKRTMVQGLNMEAVALKAAGQGTWAAFYPRMREEIEVAIQRLVSSETDW